MPPLKNQRHEVYAQIVFEVQGTNTPGYECAIRAGYAAKWARSIASRLSTNVNIRARIDELNAVAAAGRIADKQERMEHLTQIVRAKIEDYLDNGETPTLKGGVYPHAVRKFIHRTYITKKGDTVIEKTIELKDSIEAVDKLNRMDNTYSDPLPINQTNNFQFNIIVRSDQARDIVSKIMSGERLADNAAH